MVYFSEVQSFRQWWIWALLLTPLGVLAYFHPKEHAAALPALVPAVFCLWFYLAHLETEVRDEDVRLRFHLMWPTKAIPLKDIVSCEARTYKPVGEYGGWGVKGRKNNRAFNVSGNRGVQLVLAGGQRILIGSQKADDLAAAIQTRMQLVGR
jgi:hypothetical protein